MNIAADIEAILFYKGEPVKITELCKLLSKKEDEVEQGLTDLEKSLVGRGLTVVRAKDEVELRTSADTASLIEKITKEELSRDLGKAGLETLSIILYKGPISRREIDYIRGVNSTFILRNLLIRGLVQKSESDEDSRVFMYEPTLELLSHLGISKREEAPEFEKIRAEVEALMNAKPAGEVEPGSLPEAGNKQAHGE